MEHNCVPHSMEKVSGGSPLFKSCSEIRLFWPLVRSATSFSGGSPAQHGNLCGWRGHDCRGLREVVQKSVLIPFHQRGLTSVFFVSCGWILQLGKPEVGLNDGLLPLLDREGFFQRGWQVVASETATNYPNFPVGFMRWKPVSEGPKYKDPRKDKGSVFVSDSLSYLWVHILKCSVSISVLYRTHIEQPPL